MVAQQIIGNHLLSSKTRYWIIIQVNSDSMHILDYTRFHIPFKIFDISVLVNLYLASLIQCISWFPSVVSIISKSNAVGVGNCDSVATVDHPARGTRSMFATVIKTLKEASCIGRTRSWTTMQGELWSPKRWIETLCLFVLEALTKFKFLLPRLTSLLFFCVTR